MTDLHVVKVRQHDRRLGRQVVHDPRSRAFPFPVRVDTSTWRTRSVRLYDPLPNPEQVIGNCTGCAKSMEFNAVGNRVTGQVLRMDTADRLYSWASANDPWDGAWPPTDTGSSGLAAARAAKFYGLGGEYRWLFGGADEVVQTVVDGRAVNIGTWWTAGMFYADFEGVVEPTGSRVGGHQYVVRGYDESRDRLQLRCWWGGYRDVWIDRTYFAELLADDGDAHCQARIA